MFQLYRDVNEEFVNAELEKCKRKIGGKRKLEENGEGGVQGKLPKLKKETLEDQQVKENPENRLEKNDGLKEKSKTPEVIKNLVATYLLL